jgi:hypothetical protein
VFAQLARAGDLPHISRHVLEPGGMVPGTTAFPSTTGVAYLPLLTGCYPGTCNVPGIRWLDRERYAGRWWRDRVHVRSYCGYQGGLLNQDVRHRILSLFGIETDSVALCTPFKRDLTADRVRVQRPRAFYGSLAHYLEAGYGALDRAAGRALARAARGRHRLVFAVFPGLDGVTHFHDPWHPRALDMYRQLDRIVGRYAACDGLSGDHLFVLVSDHGMSRVEKHVDISLELEARGLSVLRHPIVWRRNPKLAVMVSGNASVQIYLNPGLIRANRWPLSAIEAGEVPGIPADLVSHLAALDGVALVAGTDGGDVVVVSAAGRARLAPLADGYVRYEPDTADVLGLGAETVTRSDREWLAASCDREFPDGPAQLLQVFRSPRAGDLAVVAASGADLRRQWEIPEHRSGHGSLTADHMRCLIAVNRPVAGPVRTVDLFPLVLEHLGHAVPADIDGTSVFCPGRP